MSDTETVPDMKTLIEPLPARFPAAWQKCLAPNDDGEFNARTASVLYYEHAMTRAGRNGKRGNPNDLSTDIINWRGTADEETRTKILETAKGLKSDPGLSNFVGNRVLNPDYNMGLSEEPRAGTKAATAAAKYNTLKSLLTLDNLKLLKGAMSDKDLLFLQAAGSSLDSKTDDPAFMAELDKIIGKFENIADGSQDKTPPKGKFTIIRKE